MLKRIDHLGLAVRDLDAAVALYGALFGMAEWERIELPERHMAVAVARVGGALLELITPTSDEAAFAKFLAERGEGVHHVAYEVDDIEAALAALEQAGARLIDRVPRPGIHGTRIAFLHPKAAAGVLIELVELPAAGAESSH